MSTTRGRVAVSDRKARRNPARCRHPHHERQLGERHRQPVRRLLDGQLVVSAYADATAVAVVDLDTDCRALTSDVAPLSCRFGCSAGAAATPQNPERASGTPMRPAWRCGPRVPTELRERVSVPHGGNPAPPHLRGSLATAVVVGATWGDPVARVILDDPGALACSRRLLWSSTAHARARSVLGGHLPRWEAPAGRAAGHLGCRLRVALGPAYRRHDPGREARGHAERRRSGPVPCRPAPSGPHQ